MPISPDKDAVKTETFTCVDQRNKVAKVIISDGIGQERDSILAILNVGVLADNRFGDDIVIEARMDNNIVLHVCAYSKMMKGYGVGENYTIKTPPAEIHQMCFGLEIER